MMITWPKSLMLYTVLAGKKYGAYCYNNVCKQLLKHLKHDCNVSQRPTVCPNTQWSLHLYNRLQVTMSSRLYQEMLMLKRQETNSIGNNKGYQLFIKDWNKITTQASLLGITSFTHSHHQIRSYHKIYICIHNKLDYYTEQNKRTIYQTSFCIQQMMCHWSLCIPTANQCIHFYSFFLFSVQGTQSKCA